MWSSGLPLRRGDNTPAHVPSTMDGRPIGALGISGSTAFGFGGASFASTDLMGRRRGEGSEKPILLE
jgi:hypothetical protein